MVGFMKYPAELILGIGGALSVVGSVLNSVSLLDLPDDDRKLTWKARFVAANRRHPRMHGTAMACLAASLFLFIGFVLTVLS